MKTLELELSKIPKPENVFTMVLEDLEGFLLTSSLSCGSDFIVWWTLTDRVAKQKKPNHR